MIIVIGCVGRRTAPFMWCKYKFLQVAVASSGQGCCPSTVSPCQVQPRNFPVRLSRKERQNVVLRQHGRRKVHGPGVFQQKERARALLCQCSVREADDSCRKTKNEAAEHRPHVQPDCKRSAAATRLPAEFTGALVWRTVTDNSLVLLPIPLPALCGNLHFPLGSKTQTTQYGRCSE